MKTFLLKIAKGEIDVGLSGLQLGFAGKLLPKALDDLEKKDPVDVDRQLLTIAATALSLRSDDADNYELAIYTEARGLEWPPESVT